MIFSKKSFETVGDKTGKTERDRMVKNFGDALEFQGLTVGIDD